MKLNLFLKDQLIESLTLESQYEYFAGRGDDCEIKLQGEKGISRKHIRIFHDGSSWCIELISQYGGLIFENNNVDQLTLGESTEFSIPPYVFKVEFSNEDKPSNNNDEAFIVQKAYEPVFDTPSHEVNSLEHDDSQAQLDSSSNLPSITGHSEDPNAKNNLEPSSDLVEEYEGNLESTSAGFSQLAILLIAKYPTGDEEVFKLEGHSWIAGRDPDCEIFLRNDHVSRRHFEITHTDQGIHIIDLGSSNGTFLNGQALEPNHPYLLESGDQLRVKKMELTLQVKDLEFQQRLSNISDTKLMAPIVNHASNNFITEPSHGPNFTPPINQQNYLAQYLGLDENGPGVMMEEPQSFLQKNNFKKNKIKILSILLLPLLIYGLLSDDKKNDKHLSSKNKESTPFEKLSNEEKELLKDSFRLARSYLTGAKFSLCLSEIQKIHDLVPHYERSRSIEKTCAAGLDIQDKQRAEQEEREKQARTEQQIKSIVSECSLRINDFSTLDELNACLAQAIELNPGSLEIEELQTSLKTKIESSQNQAALNAEKQRLIALGERKYINAMDSLKQNNLLNSIKKLNQFLNANYPDPKNNRTMAQRTLASTKKKLELKITSLLNDCKALSEEGKFKEAYSKCKDAKLEDPKNNDVIDTQSKIKHQLTRKMKELYDNASIEENYGNIEAARDIWKKIITDDFKEGSVFFMRAKRKLKKYGDD